MSTDKARQCVCAQIQKTARCVTQLYDRYLRPAGLRPSQYAMLMGIRRHGPIAVGDLGETLRMDQSTAVRNVSVLRQAGWVETAAGDDARQKLVSLTQAGEEKLDAARPHWSEAQSRMEDGLRPEELVALFAILRRIQDLTGEE